MERVEGIRPYGDDTRDKGSQVEEMFDNIAPAYDLMNRAMTLGIDRLWRRSAVRRISAAAPSRIVDIATGTGDLAIALARRNPRATVTGVDLSAAMMEIGRQKASEAGCGDRITWVQGDCMALPLADDSADAVTAAYGVRNFADIRRGYTEMFRILRPGGRIAVLELSTPTLPVIRTLYKIYTRTLVPALGRMVSRDRAAYTYLPASISAVPQGRAMTNIMQQAGFTHCRAKTFTLGVCTLYTAIKPQ